MTVTIEGNEEMDELEMEQLQPSISYSQAQLCLELRQWERLQLAGLSVGV